MQQHGLELEGIMLSERTQIEEDECHMMSFICEFKKNNTKNKLMYRDKLVNARSKGWRVSEMHGGGQKVQTSRSKINESRGLVYSMVTH